MTDLRTAAQQALEALESGLLVAHHAKVLINLRAALAQQDEPKGGGNLPPPLQAEPVLVVEKEPDYMSRGHFYEGSKPFIDPTLVWKLPIGTKLYTAPPRREWQGLSEEDMEDLLPLYSDPSANTEMLEFAAAIEAKLKEKNNG
jgi:hypothetical protein